MIENSKQLDYKRMPVSDIIEDEVRNIEYTACLWYCYLIYQFFSSSFDEFYNFVNRVKNDSKLSKADIELVQLCLSESLLKEISNERFAFSADQILGDKKLKQRFDEDGIPIKSGRINVYTRIKDQLLTNFKYCEENYCQQTNTYKKFPYVLEAVKQHTIKNEECQKVKIPTLYFPFKGTFQPLYLSIKDVFKLSLNDNCLAKLHKLFDTFNLNFDDADFSYNMAKTKFERKKQDVRDGLAEMRFKSAVNNEEDDYDEFLEETFGSWFKEAERKDNEKSDFLKRLEKIGDAIINQKYDSDEKLFEKHKTTCSNQAEEDYWYLYDQFHDSFGNYHDYGK